MPPRPQARRRKPAKPPAKRPGLEGGARDLNRRDNLRRLQTAGLALFLAEGTEAVTIDRIASAAGMAKGSFYRYAADKAALVEQIMAPIAADVIVALERCEHALRATHAAGLAACYLALAGELSAIVARAPTCVLLYLQEARAPAAPARRAIHALAAQLLARATTLTQIARAGGLIRDVDPRLSALIVIGAIEAILVIQLRAPAGGAAAGDATAITTELVTTVLRGIRA